MSDKPDLLLVANLGREMERELAARFTLHREPGEHARRIRAIVGSGTSVVGADLVAALPALEIIAIHGVGHEGIDLEAVRDRKLRLTLTLGVLTDDVADLAIGLMLDVQRKISANDRLVRDGGWRTPLARRASGRRIGVFGMGAIGEAIARRAEPFAAEVIYASRTAKPALPWRALPDLASLALESDVLVLAASVTAETRGSVDADVLDRLGPDGVLVNIARGALVDEPALIAALTEGRIRGAGLDVFADEPNVPDALRRLPNVVLSPHQGSATVEGRAQMAALLLANLDAHFRGEAPPTALI